ncbi:phosphodiesterase [Umezawaea sp. Da 62-37]|uniref:phosphodiesterase n=1 Tax=Umezawaea sp. Da 62-37 TaxID=3075927 RepID=UPI0028F6CA09|nr:phosphodiesterase [Umezawaea sp. Da 62-37]WNV90406.1 phosphodiesterase [Umezawaea sp. Da 62-37]
MITLAHLSDIHIDGSGRNEARARKVVDYLAALPGRVDAVLVTGDLTEEGRPVDYGTVREIVAPLDVPVLFCPGNHDEREAFRRTLLRIGGTGPVNQAVEVAGASILLLDSVVPGEPGGALAPETLAWLDSALSRSDGPAFVALHHPPVALGIPELDAMRLGNPDDLAHVLARHPRVVGVLCGHAHTGAASTFAGLPLRAAPGVKNTTLLPWEHDGDITRHDAPVGLAFHLHADDVLTTHYRSL